MINILALSSTIIISLLSLTGISILLLGENYVKQILIFLVSLSAGTLMGSAFFHLLPEALTGLPINTVLRLTLFAFILFFFIEKILHWHHCHNGICDIHTIGHMNLIGDSIHNFLDGLIIASAFLTDLHLGIVTAITISLHEIPQELGDFGVLLHSGWGVKKAVLLNILAALTAILGTIIGLFFGERMELVSLMMLPIAAGGFLYIAASDLLPEIIKVNDRKSTIITFFIFLAGVYLMYFLV